jgi:hypothetical protein
MRVSWFLKLRVWVFGRQTPFLPPVRKNPKSCPKIPCSALYFMVVKSRESEGWWGFGKTVVSEGGKMGSVLLFNLSLPESDSF